MAAETDRHLLFGLLALQTGLIQPAQLVAAFHAWTCDKARPLADHLVALGYLTPFCSASRPKRRWRSISAAMGGPPGCVGGPPRARGWTS